MATSTGELEYFGAAAAAFGTSPCPRTATNAPAAMTMLAEVAKLLEVVVLAVVVVVVVAVAR